MELIVFAVFLVLWLGAIVALCAFLSAAKAEPPRRTKRHLHSVNERNHQCPRKTT